MAVLIPLDDDMSEYSVCEVIYQVIFARNLVHDNITFCPFCGSELEFLTDEDDEQ